MAVIPPLWSNELASWWDSPEAKAMQAQTVADAQAAAQLQQQNELAAIEAANAQRAAETAAAFGGYTGYDRAPVEFAPWVSDMSGVTDWGPLGTGYTGPPRAEGEPNPSGRFDWETPGSALAVNKLSNEQAARGFHQAAMMYGTPEFGGAGGGMVPVILNAMIREGQLPAQETLPNGQPYIPLGLEEAEKLFSGSGLIDPQYYDPENQRLYVSAPGGSGADSYIDDALAAGYTLEQLQNMGPAEAAYTYDRVIASREAENQQPKRGISPTNILAGITGLAFGPAAGAVVGMASNAAQGDPLGVALSATGLFGQTNQNPISAASDSGLDILGDWRVGQGIPAGGQVVHDVGLPGAVETAGNVLGSIYSVLGSGAPSGGTVPSGGAPASGSAGGVPQETVPGGTTEEPLPGSVDWENLLAEVAAIGAGGGAGGGAGSFSVPTAQEEPTTMDVIPQAQPIPLGAATVGLMETSPTNPFSAEMARLLGEPGFLKHKTRPGASGNILSRMQPRGAYG